MDLISGQEHDHAALLAVTALAEGPPVVEAPAAADAWVGTLVKNSAANIVRLGVTSLIAILLPIYLTHHLSIQVYGAWVLILQIGAYVSYLNLGVQTALAKFVAEYRTKQDADGCSECVSAGLTIMLAASLLGILLTGALVYFIPQLFPGMAVSLLHDVRLSVFFVGTSLAIGLATSVFSGIFLGLERYQVPMVVMVCSRITYAVVVCATVLLHRGLITMAVASAIVTLLTSVAEVLAWRKLAPFVRVSVRGVTRDMLKRMLAYCSILTVWSACMLFISGLDVTIVGHYAFREVAFYSIAGSPTNMVLMIIGAVLGPFLPAASAISVGSTSTRMGKLLVRSTRYSTIILLVTGLPIMVAGYPLLRAWVGPVYAVNSVLFLDMLLLANITRNLLAPYATMVVATARQRVATASALTEAAVNLAASILLARHFGAIGVAAGTLVGAVAGVAMHFFVSMHYTYENFAVGRLRLLLGGIVHPAIMALPSILLVRFWWGSNPAAISRVAWVGWFVSTVALVWFVSLSAEDRGLARGLVRRSLGKVIELQRT